MKKNNRDKKILIIDFGSQYTQLIARRIRELGVFSEISNHKQIKNVNVEELFGIIHPMFAQVGKYAMLI